MMTSGNRPSRRSSSWSLPASWAAPRRSTHSAAVAKATRCPARHARMPRAIRQVTFAGAGRAQEHGVGAGFDEVQGAQVSHDVLTDAALMLEVEVLEGFAGREASGAD